MSTKFDHGIVTISQGDKYRVATIVRLAMQDEMLKCSEPGGPNGIWRGKRADEAVNDILATLGIGISS